MTLIKNSDLKSSLSKEEEKYLQRAKERRPAEEDFESLEIRTMADDIDRLLSEEKGTSPDSAESLLKEERKRILGEKQKRQEELIKKEKEEQRPGEERKGQEVRKTREEEIRIKREEEAREREEAVRIKREEEAREREEAVRRKREEEIRKKEEVMRIKREEETRKEKEEAARRKREEDRQRRILEAKRKTEEARVEKKLLLSKIREEKEKIRQLLYEKNSLILLKRQKAGELVKTDYIFAKKRKETKNLSTGYQNLIRPFKIEEEEKLRLEEEKEDIKKQKNGFQEEIQSKIYLGEEFRKEKEGMEDDLKDWLLGRRELMERVENAGGHMFLNLSSQGLEASESRNYQAGTAFSEDSINLEEEEEEEEALGLTGSKIEIQLNELIRQKEKYASEIRILKSEIPIIEKKIEESRENIQKDDEEKKQIQLKIQNFKKSNPSIRLRELKRQIAVIKKYKVNFLYEKENLRAKVRKAEADLSKLQGEKKEIEEKFLKEKEDTIKYFDDLKNLLFERKENITKNIENLKEKYQKEKKESENIQEGIEEFKSLIPSYEKERHKGKELQEEKEKIKEEEKELQEEKEKISLFFKTINYNNKLVNKI